jgi:glycosyltransferase involved in cell wall biosynthesis
MNVLLVSQEVPPETWWGGIGTYVDVLSEALSAKGAEVHVLSVVDGQLSSTTRLGAVTVHRRPLPHVRGAGRLPPEAWRRLWLPLTVERLVRRLSVRPGVIECPEWMAEGLALGVRGTFPLVVRLHSSARQLFPHTGQGTGWHGLEGRAAAWLEETSARRANVVVSTRSNLDEMVRRLGLDPGAVHAIPYPVRLPPLAPWPHGQPPRVTFVGRLEPRKAPDVVLRAAPEVLAKVPEARFVFVGRDVSEPGRPPSARWLRAEAARLGIADAVELTGQLDRAGVAEQLRLASVCAFPSRWESFGNVVAEASATGRRVVVSSIAPFRELVQDGVTGRIVSGEHPATWAKALVEVLGDRRRAEAMGRAGAARIAAISAPERVAELALAAYEHAIERWRAGSRAGRRR